MRVLVAMDSFKGTLSAQQACDCVKRGLLKSRPDLEVITKPMADGGEGTLDVMLNNTRGRRMPLEVSGPIFGRKVQASFGWFPETKKAVVEMAEASGLLRISDVDRNPMKTTTFGTGELLRAAFKQRPREVLLAVGGSATVDGGVGAAMALGWRFLDAGGKSVGYGGESLLNIKSIIPAEEEYSLKFRVLCDVDNPLCGPQGAARVYGPQKGATSEMVLKLEEGFENLAQLVKEQMGLNIADIPGGGAAGGLAAGAVAFMGADLVPGSATVMAAIDLDDEIRKAGCVITGEGRFDGQSARGKVVAGLAAAARKRNVPVIVIAGDVDAEVAEKSAIVFKRAISARPSGMDLKDALANAAKLLERAAEEAAGEL